MKSLTLARFVSFLLVASACGGTVALGRPPDGGRGVRTTGSAGSTATSTSTRAAGDRPGTGGNPGTGGTGGTNGVDAGPLGCGARLGNTCPGNMFCDFAPEAMCG